MERKHVEFIQSQNVVWSSLPDGRQAKILSEEPSTGDRAALIRMPPGWGIRTEGALAAEEFYVLDGSIEIGGETYSRNHYGFLPYRERAEARSSAEGALVLSFRFAANDPSGHSEPLNIDAAAMPWDISTLEPKLVHLRLARKILRLGPDDSSRSYLLAGLPHGFPEAGQMPVERHPHTEEMFLIQGEMKAPEGVMRDGAYFYRPAQIEHGPHISEFGFLMFMRTRGSSRIITEWMNQSEPLPMNPPFQPRAAFPLPAEWREGVPARPQY